MNADDTQSQGGAGRSAGEDVGGSAGVGVGVNGSARRDEAILRLLDRPIGGAELEAGAEAAALPAPVRASRDQTRGLLLFRLGEETMGFPATALARVTEATRPIPIPHRTRGVFRGLCNVRGELILCADLRRLLGLPEPRSKHPGESPESGGGARRMVVVGPADARWAFEVDALVGMERVAKDRLIAPTMTVAESLRKFTEGIADVGAERVTVLDAARVLAGFEGAIS
jgi:chemotaxis signal transduction protein